MEPSTSSAVHEFPLASPLAWAALGCAAVAAVLLIWYLVRRPPLTSPTKILLLLGIGVFPIGAAFTGNIVGYETSTERHFCGGCHVMGPYQRDSEDPRSATLAARHARNAEFGAKNCYACHADYGMFGAVTTKLAGLRHVWEYYGNGYHAMSLEEARGKIHLLRPYPNANCVQCHSTRLPGWNAEPEHQAIVESLDRGEVSCASAGCHGPAHPFSKKDAAPRAEARP